MSRASIPQTVLREFGLQGFTSKLLQLGVRSVEDLSDPTNLSDVALIKLGMTPAQVWTARHWLKPFDEVEGGGDGAAVMASLACRPHHKLRVGPTRSAEFFDP
jgi:hypothetical protein